MFYQRKICTCFPEDFISFRRPTSGRVSLFVLLHRRFPSRAPTARVPDPRPPLFSPNARHSPWPTRRKLQIHSCKYSANASLVVRRKYRCGADFSCWIELEYPACLRIRTCTGTRDAVRRGPVRKKWLLKAEVVQVAFRKSCVGSVVVLARYRCRPLRIFSCRSQREPRRNSSSACRCSGRIPLHGQRVETRFRSQGVPA